MKNSNDSYRVTNCRSGELHTDQTIELEESIKNKLIAQKQLKRRMFEVGQDIANIEYVVKKCQEEADTINAYIEGIEIICSCLIWYGQPYRVTTLKLVNPVSENITPNNLNFLRFSIYQYHIQLFFWFSDTCESIILKN